MLQFFGRASLLCILYLQYFLHFRLSDAQFTYNDQNVLHSFVYFNVSFLFRACWCCCIFNQRQHYQLPLVASLHIPKKSNNFIKKLGRHFCFLYSHKFSHYFSFIMRVNVFIFHRIKQIKLHNLCFKFCLILYFQTGNRKCYSLVKCVKFKL